METQDQKLFAALALLALTTATALGQDSLVHNPAPAPHATAIPFDQIGAVAGKQYSGDGLAVSDTSDGARLRCVFQRLDGHVTSEGLWLVSTKDRAKGEPFRVVARGLDRDGVQNLSVAGKVGVKGQTVQFIRPGLTEEYSVGIDGLRQDFVIEHRPLGHGPLRLELEVDGAKAEAMAAGARLVLAAGGRNVVYNRLKTFDARGKELKAKLEVSSPNRLVLVLDDSKAQYPVRIDPTFSDANWVALGSGMNGTVYCLAVSGGTVYVGGSFTVAGGVAASNIAEWNGSSWSALGSGISGMRLYGDGPEVYALAVSGSNLYAGGNFNTAGGVSANYIAQWNGSSWSPLDSGMDLYVTALAISGGYLYAGGFFSSAGEAYAPRIAQWNGSSWSALGSGIWGTSSDGNGPYVSVLAVSGTNLYVGGDFSLVGEYNLPANNIAEWNGSSWSDLGGGIDGPGSDQGNYVSALAVSGSNLYVGGDFGVIGNITANYIAQWNGLYWSGLGSGHGGGMNGPVMALTVSGATLFAGGNFTEAGGDPLTGTGGVAANNIAEWNGNSWSPLGSGANNSVDALTMLGPNLIAGGEFTKAGITTSSSIAEALTSFPFKESFATGLNGPAELAFDSAGDLFVSEYNTGNIYKYIYRNTAYAVRSTFASGLNRPKGLAFDGAGNLFVAGNGSGKIYEFTTNGIQSTFASGLNQPSWLALDHEGNLYESDYGSGNIYEFTTNGVRSTFASGLSYPAGLAFNDAGDLFEADYGSGNIYKFITNGVRSTAATLGSNSPSGLAVDDVGDVFAADNASNAITEITASGAQNTFAPGLNHPDGLAFDSAGDLFEADYGSGNIYELSVANANPGGSFGVTNLDDSGPGTLRTAIQMDTNGATITFAPSLSGGVITLASTLTISSDITIDASASGGIQINGNGAVQILNVAPNTAVALNYLTLVNGYSPSEGGGIYNSGELTMTNCTLSQNKTVGSAATGGLVSGGYGASAIGGNGSGGNSYGGGIFNVGSLILAYCTLCGNTATGGTGTGGPGFGGEGLVNFNSTFPGNGYGGNGHGGSGYGGGIFNAGSLNLICCTLSWNSAIGGNGYGGNGYGGPWNIDGYVGADGFGGYGEAGNGYGGGIDNGRILAVNECTLYENSAVGGLSVGGYGYYAYNGINDISYVYMGSGQGIENSASDVGGGIYCINSTNTLLNCTVSGNITAGSGGGICQDASNPGMVAFTNTIVAGNNASSGANIFGSPASFSIAYSLTNGNPLLAPLGNYGGSTQTMPPLPGSPAIAAGNVAANSFTTDQRGYPRVFNGLIDIGAVELPTVQFTADPTNGFAPLGVQFSSTSVDGDGSPITQWNWNFNDNATSASESPGHVYNRAGIYSPSLVMYDSLGLTLAASGPSILAYGISGISNNPSGGSTTLSLAGYPGSTNYLYATTNLALPLWLWQLIATNVADSNGLFQFIDAKTEGVSAKFYRLSGQP